MPTAPNSSDSRSRLPWIAFLLISCSTLSTAFSQGRSLDSLQLLEPRPIRLTETQARQAIADRATVLNLTYQVGELRKAQASSDTLVTGLRQRIVDQDDTIRKQIRVINAQRAELWAHRSTILAALISLIVRK
jgi:hypothetical protein